MASVIETLKAIRERIVGPAWKEQAKNSFNNFKGYLGVLRGRAGGPVPNAKYDELDEVEGESLEPGERSGMGRTYQPGLCSWCSKLPCNCPKRYLMALMCSIGFMISFGIRCNVDFAKAVLRHNMSHPANTSETPNAPYGHHIEWNHRIASVVDSSFFWGYLVTQIPGGIIASKLPATWVFGGAIISTSVLNMFIPTAVTIHYGLVVVIRITQGLVEGATYPACHGIWRYWAPPLERSRLATIAFCGSYAGAVLGLFLSGVLSQGLGWPSAFYFYGSFGIIWFSFWFFLAHETPASHPTISDEERVYIQTAIGTNSVKKQTGPIPWGKFFTSMPVYAIIVANFARSWSFYLLILTNPKYFSDVFKENMGSSGALSALPHLVMATIVPIGGQLADFLRKGILSTTAVRKIFNCGGFGLEACFLLGVGYTRNSTTAMVCLTIAVGCSGFAISGYNVNHLDIAPNYASILMGLSNGVGTLSGMICPVVAEYLTRDGSVDSWEKVYLIASLVHFSGVAFYAIFASGEKQPWADPPEEVETWKPSPLPPEAKQDDYSYGNDSSLPHSYDYGGGNIIGDSGSKLSAAGVPDYSTQTYYVQKDGSMSTTGHHSSPANGHMYDSHY